MAATVKFDASTIAILACAAVAGLSLPAQSQSSNSSTNGPTNSSTPATTGTTTTTSTSTSTSTSTTNQTQVKQSPSAQITAQGTVIPATSRQQALNEGNRTAGRSDPLAPIEGFKPFPTGSTLPEKADAKIKDNKSAQMQVPPPPTGAVGFKDIPPPPPFATQDDMPVSELPLPPDRPSLAAKLRLTGVIGDKAIFAFTDREAARLNKWPGVLLMGAGDRFESVETVSVGTDSAILEEDGERSTKTLERIR